MLFLVPELEVGDLRAKLVAATRSEPRKHKFKFGAADESSPSIKQRLSLGSTSKT